MIRIVRYFVNLFNDNQNDKLISNMNNYDKKKNKKLHSKTYSFFTEETQSKNN